MPFPVNGTSWNVAVFTDGAVGPFDPIPWVFQGNGTVSASGAWTGSWEQTGDNQVSVATDQGDKFVVVFVTSDWFVATQNDELYRLGRSR